MRVRVIACARYMCARAGADKKENFPALLPCSVCMFLGEILCRCLTALFGSIPSAGARFIYLSFLACFSVLRPIFGGRLFLGVAERKRKKTSKESKRKIARRTFPRLPCVHPSAAALAHAFRRLLFPHRF